MRAPGFWYRPPGILARLLAPAGFVYGQVAGRRMAGPAEGRAAVPVVCVGNLTAGGAGKTPGAMAIADRLRTMGRTPGILMRGYGGTMEGPVAVDPHAHTASDVGDEALLHARWSPTVVSADRNAGAALLARSADVIVMDDGLQNPSLVKDLALVVVDTDTGIGNGSVMPAGPLRAPVAAQMRHADAIVALGASALPPDLLGHAIHRATMAPDARFRALAGRRVLAYTGIGRPEKFFAMLAAIGAIVVERRDFGDHHAFSSAEAGTLIEVSASHRLTPVTTDKDFVRLAGDPRLEELAALTSTVGVSVSFADEAAVRTLLGAAIGRSPRGGA